MVVMNVKSGVSLEGDDVFCLVGIGASAGGLEALQEFFSNISPGEEYSFVVVQHLSPDYKSLMPELLSRHTNMPIQHVVDGMTIAPGNVYILPPKNNVSVFKGQLFLTPPEHELNLPIDVFFNSLAEEFGERAIGVILSGTGTDGTRGTRAIKEHGGFAIAQSEETAAFDGMPRSAISTGLCDAVLSPKEIAIELPSICQSLLTKSHAEPSVISSTKKLAKILSLVKLKTGLDFSYYKNSTIIRRIERRIGLCKCDSVEEYLEYIEGNPREIETLQREFLIGVTRFFRDPGAFKALKKEVLPIIMNSKSVNDQIRVWVAGCSTGEEAYTIAIIMDEYFESIGVRPDVKIFATDIDRGALEVAAQGIYPLSIAADASLDRLGKYFFKKGDGYQIQPRIRKQVVFAYHNIIKDPPFPRMDLISCRNLLIYLQNVLQKKVLSNFSFSLNKGGFLLLGSSESVGDLTSSFNMFSNNWKIHRFTGHNAEKIPMHFEKELLPLSRHPEVISGLNDSTRDSYDIMLAQLMEACMPPTVLINEERQILHLFGDVDRYLQIKAGRPENDLLRLARGNLSLPLSSLLKESMAQGKDVLSSKVPYRNGDTVEYVELTIRGLRGAPNRQNYAVTFERPVQNEMNFKEFDIEEGIRNRISDLEKELQYTKENLQATIEELETSNEELQATNEELLAANEELQSTNEELQSVNEELVTVNSEYQSKIHELTELNEDMDNLMSATNVGVIFLDNDLRIRRYTNAATRVFKIISSDINRSVTDLKYDFDLPSFTDDLRSVLSKGATITHEILDSDGGWYELQMIPYNGRDTMTKGVLVVIINIDHLKSVEQQLRSKHDQFIRMLETSPVATTMLDKDGRLYFANSVARELLGLVENSLGDFTFDDEEFSITDLEGAPIPTKDLPFMQIKESKACRAGLSHNITRNGVTTTLKISGCPMFDQDGEIEGVVFSIEPLDTSDNG